MRKIEEIDYPKTKEEWWALVDHHREALLRLVEHYHPYYHRVHTHKITAPAAEAACEVVRQAITEEDQRDPWDRFVEYVEKRDPDLCSLLNEVWFGMPESMEVRAVDGFDLLCHLCSDSYVLQEDEDAADQS